MFPVMLNSRAVAESSNVGPSIVDVANCAAVSQMSACRHGRNAGGPSGAAGVPTPPELVMYSSGSGPEVAVPNNNFMTPCGFREALPSQCDRFQVSAAQDRRPFNSGTAYGAARQRNPAEAHSPHGMHRITSGVELQRAPSLLFAMEFEDDPVATTTSDTTRLRLSLEQLVRLMACSAPSEKQLQHIVHDAKDAGAMTGTALTCNRLAAILEEIGYEVCIRTALGGGDGIDCLHNLRHNFLLVRCPGAGFDAPRYIVDIDFRAQFEVAQSTDYYSSLLENMESEFVGTETKLRAVIHFLCEEMATAFREQEVGLPPWRQAASMLSKWCPRRSEDFSLRTNSESAGPASSPGAPPQLSASLKDNAFHGFATSSARLPRQQPDNGHLPRHAADPQQRHNVMQTPVQQAQRYCPGQRWLALP